MSDRLLSPLKYPVIWFSLAYATLILVAVLSLVPAPDMGGSDKLLHLLTYFVLSATFSILIQQHKRVFFIAFGLMAYGVLLEVAQGMTGYRMMDGQDMLANSVGVFLGLLVRLTPVPKWFRIVEARCF